MTMLKQWMNRTPDEQVIMSSASQQNLPVKGKQLIDQIKLSCKTGKFAIMRAKNTIFWYHIDSPEMVNVTIFNTDSLEQMAKNLRSFGQALSVAGYKYWYIETNDEPILRAIRLSRVPTKIQQIPGKASPMYRVVAAALPSENQKTNEAEAV